MNNEYRYYLMCRPKRTWKTFHHNVSLRAIKVFLRNSYYKNHEWFLVKALNVQLARTMLKKGLKELAGERTGRIYATVVAEGGK